MYICVFLLFFFFKQKTAYEMRISDWSSDVCSSDLLKGDDGSKQILSFKADTLRIFPKANKPYERESEFGTAIKLYEYDMKGFGSHALMTDGLKTDRKSVV